MVVTRRTTIPMPPTSRTASSQATPKISRGKAAQSPLIVHDVDENLLNGTPSLEVNHSGPQFSDDVLFSDGSPPRKAVRDRTKTKSKRKEGKHTARHRRRQTSWLDLFSRAFILFFLIYSLSVCPTADKEKSPVCRALFEYRRLVLEPYVITPIQNLLHHPSVAPYTTPIIQKALPVIARSQQEWNSRVVPQWKAHVVPQWEKHVVPAWNTHVSPQLARLDAKVDPLRRRAVDLYDKYAVPYVRQARVLAYKVQPHLVLAGAKAHHAYQTSKPYLAHLYQELHRIPPVIVEYVVKPLASARRQYVDPHVALLLEKIQELSSAASKTESVHDNVTSSSEAGASQASQQVQGANKYEEMQVPVVSEAIVGDDSISSVASVVSASLSLGSGSGEITSTASASLAPELLRESAAHASTSSVISSSPILGSEVTELVLGATYSAEPEVDIDVAQGGNSQVELKAEPKTASFSENADIDDTVVRQGGTTDALKRSGTESVSSSIPDGTDDKTGIPPLASDYSASATPSDALFSDVPKAHRPIAPATSAEDDEELNDLLAELGLDLEETVSSDPPPTASVVEETEEEKAVREAQRLAEVAEKRQELTARHTKWEEKLSDTIETQKVVLKEALASIRRTGAAELKINLAIRAGIETLNSEAEKALRGTDAYFTKLRTGGKPLTEQARLWDRVLEKVQGKFEDRVQDVEEAVNKWYEEEVLSKERQEIEKASEIVRSVADDAQADIGLDYAWLDDVTFMDWKRYHALLDRHQAFLDEQIAFANGSHATPYINPVLDAFEDLRSEVQDITLGFETRMRRIKREGDRAFAEIRTETEPASPDPEVSILPVTDDDKKHDKAFQEVADAILGRSEEEVAAALGRAQEQEPQVVHEEL